MSKITLCLVEEHRFEVMDSFSLRPKIMTLAGHLFAQNNGVWQIPGDWKDAFVKAVAPYK